MNCIMEICYMYWNLQSLLQRIVALWFSMSALYCTLYSTHPFANNPHRHIDTPSYLWMIIQYWNLSHYMPNISIVILIHHHTFERPSNIEVSIRISMMNLFMKRVVNTCSSADICSSLFRHASVSSTHPCLSGDNRCAVKERGPQLFFNVGSG